MHSSTRSLCLTIVLLLLVSLTTFGQTFEGRIVYETSYKSKIKNVSDEQLTRSMGSSFEYFIKGNKYLSRTNGSYLEWQLYVPTENRIYNKFSTSETPSWIDAATVSDEVIKIVVRKSVTSVLGYQVDEVLITCRNSVQKYYVSDKLAIDPTAFSNHKFGNWYDLLSTAKALPLKWTHEGAEFSLETVATKIHAGKLDDRLFELPGQKQTAALSD